LFGKIGSRMILAVDWDVRQLRLVHAGVRGGKVLVDRMLAVDVPAEVDTTEPEALGKLIRQVLDQQRIRTDRAVLDVPRDQALLTTLSLPPTAPEELPALVEFQIVKEIPFPLADAVVDFSIPSNPPEGKIDVLVGTVRRDVVAYYERTCAAAGLKLDRLGLRPHANNIAVNELYGAERYRGVVMVDIGPRLTEIDIVAGGRLAFSRAASVPVPRNLRGGAAGDASGDTTFGAVHTEEEDESGAIIQFPATTAKPTSDADRVVQAIVVEVTRSIEAYRASPNAAPVEMVVVGGSTGLEARLAELLGTRYNVSAELYNPARQFGWPEERGREARAFAAALGLAAGFATEGRLHFDFLHPKRAVTATARRLRKAPAIGAVAAIFAVAAGGFYFKTIAPKQRELSELHKQTRAAETQLKELAKVEEHLAVVDEFEKTQVNWLDEMDRLARLLPDNRQMVLTRLDMYQKGGRVNLQFEATNEQVAHEAAARINAHSDAHAKAGHLKATVGATRRGGTKENYPVTGSFDIEVDVKAVPPTPTPTPAPTATPKPAADSPAASPAPTPRAGKRTPANRPKRSPTPRAIP
jgi:type IV pilus assembly protein PilM